MDKLSYALGLNIGHQLSQMGAKGLNIDDFAQAIKDIIAGNDTAARRHRSANNLTEVLPGPGGEAACSTG